MSLVHIWDESILSDLRANWAGSVLVDVRARSLLVLNLSLHQELVSACLDCAHVFFPAVAWPAFQLRVVRGTHSSLVGQLGACLGAYAHSQV